MQFKYSLLSLALVSILLSSCKKNTTSDSPSPELTGGKLAPDGFTYSTSKEVKINIRLLTNNNQPIKGVVVNLFNTSANSAKTNNALFKAVSDANGYVKGSVTLPSYIDTVVIEPNYVGLLSHVKALISNNAVDAIIGGSKGYFGNVIPQGLSKSMSKSSFTIKDVFQGINYNYPNNATVAASTIQPNGRPTYREATGDVITSGLLELVNTCLPEYRPIPSVHPEYISDQAVSTLNVISETDVYVTFVSEGAGYLNGVGFYTYPTNTPPTTIAEAGDVTFIYPNASGGLQDGLISGDKVNIGHFSPGTSIGFVLFQNAWKFNSAKNSYDVDLSGLKFYSNSVLNPEPSSANKKHTVLLHNVPNQLFVVGFEDIQRQNDDGSASIYCDQDFNDLVLFATTDGVSTVGLVPTPTTPDDCDNDGVLDAADAFPCDPIRAYKSYFSGSLAFEDNWPKKGDYDMNDLVVNYTYEMVSNASNNVVEMTGKFVPKAAGAAYKNGFGVQFPFSPSAVSQVTGQKTIGSYIQFASSGLEAGQSKAVIIPFDSQNALINNVGGGNFINTNESLPKVQGDTAKVYIKFVSTMSTASIGSAPFNPFLIGQQTRGIEIHLPGYAPTDKANLLLFGTEHDNSDPATGKYYLTATNEPWALSTLTTFDYPQEGVRIDMAYPHFLEWAATGGLQYADWYSNLSADYRNASYIYSK